MCDNEKQLKFFDGAAPAYHPEALTGASAPIHAGCHGLDAYYTSLGHGILPSRSCWSGNPDGHAVDGR